MSHLGRFEHLSRDKFNIIEALIQSKEIVKAVGNDIPNFKDNDIEEPELLLYKNIFPYRFVPDLTDTEHTFIALSFEGYQPTKGQKFKYGRVIFNVFTHNNLQRTDYQELRPDYIIKHIDKLFNNTRVIGGIGKVEFWGMDSMNVNEKYSGNWIGYTIYDWN